MSLSDAGTRAREPLLWTYNASMIDSHRTAPPTSRVNGHEVALIELIEHGVSGSAACIYSDESGERRYVTLDEWIACSAPSNAVTSHSPASDKIALFQSLFKGRDMFAKGFPVDGGKIGYYPICRKRKTEACPKKCKRGFKCVDCTHQDFPPLDRSMLLAHFSNHAHPYRDVVGMYVTDEESRTHVLVGDFDKAGWQQEALAFAHACREHGIDAAIERSRSGNGAHVWVFFDTAIPASLARRLGFAMMDYAMAHTPGMSFKAYDRFFPAQDSIAKGGFGNLIALPFQGWARSHGNTVFVDDDMSPYADQWLYLSGIRKTTRGQIDTIISSLPISHRDSHSGQPSPIQQPWNTGARDALSPSDFPQHIEIVRANMLFIPLEGLSTKAADRIRRLAAFGNSEFFRKQAMRQSVRDTPAYIDLSSLEDGWLKLPRGCEQSVKKLLETNDISYHISDERYGGTAIRVEFMGALRPDQESAAVQLVQHDSGILSAPTGFGKTVIGSWIISHCKQPTLVIVPRNELLTQWRTSLKQFLDIQERPPILLTKSGKPSKRKNPIIGQYGGGKHKLSGIIDVATYQSLFEESDVTGLPRVADFVRKYGLVICDECHHGAAPQLERVLSQVNPRYIYGLSATPKREDRLERITYLHLGPIRCVIDPKEQAAQQSFARILIPRFTYIRLPRISKDTPYTTVISELLKSQKRNRMIVEDAVSAIQIGRTPLIITSRVDHARLLAHWLEEALAVDSACRCRVILLCGSDSAKERRQAIELLHSLTQTERFVMVATGSYVGEGFDVPRLDTLLLAAPSSYESVITQYSGRLHREYEGKHDVMVYDYIDANVPRIDRMYEKRLRTYKKLCYEVASNAAVDIDQVTDGIIDAKAALDLIKRDLETAKHSIVMSSPYIMERRVEQIYPTLKDACQRGIEVRIITKISSDEKTGRPDSRKPSTALDSLMPYGCTLEYRKERPASYLAIDQELVWFGSIPPLAFPRKDDCSVRFHSAEVAYALVDRDGIADPSPPLDVSIHLIAPSSEGNICPARAAATLR